MRGKLEVGLRGARVVVVSDDRPVRETAKVVLGGYGPVVALAASECADRADMLEAASVVVSDLDPDTLTDLVRKAKPRFSREILPLTPAPSAPRGSDHLPFDPDDLARRVRRAIEEPTAAPRSTPVDVISSLVAREVAEALPRVAAGAMPVLLIGEPGCGKFRVARAIQSLRGDHFVALPAADLSRVGLNTLLGATNSRPTTLYLEEITRLPPQAHGVVRDLTTDQGVVLDGAWRPVRLVVSSTSDYEAIRRSLADSPGVLQALSGAILRLTPLRQRLAEIDTLVATICRNSARPTAHFDPQAVDLLRDYLWPGNLAELEAVITRTLVNAPADEIQAADVRLSPHDSPGIEHPPQARDTAAGWSRDTSFDLLVTELAHDFKNPMVVIKTAAQHLERVLDDASGGKDFARMTGEAVDRMDRALENLLQFSRFEDPEAGDIAIGALFTSCLANVDDDLADKRIVLDQRIEPGSLVRVDPLQLAHAIENLLRTMLRDLVPGTKIQIRSLPDQAGFALEFPLPKQRVSQHLASAAGSGRGPGSNEPQSMGVRMAQELIERNSGRMTFTSNGERRVIRVELPSGGGVVESDEATTRFDS